MADMADILDALQSVCIAALYPSGTGAASVTGKPINVGQGWPPPGAVDDAMGKGQSLVSISPINGTTSKLPVPLTVGGYGVVTAPVHGLTAVVSTASFVLMGAPGPGEYLAIIVGRAAYSYSTVMGDTARSVMMAVAAIVPRATFDGMQVNISASSGIQVRIGAPGVGGQVIDRQAQNFQIITWAPSHSDRTAVGKPLDVAIKQNLTVKLPDTSTSLWWVQNTNFIDKYQDELAYRRDMIVKCQWDTLDVYPAYEIVAIPVTQNPGPTSVTNTY